MLRRVVITGLGLVTPLGLRRRGDWSRLIAGAKRRAPHRGVRGRRPRLPDRLLRSARRRSAEGKFNPDDWMEPKEQRKVDDFIIYAMAAAEQALEDAGWKADTPEKQERTGVLIGSGIGGLTRHRRDRRCC